MVTPSTSSVLTDGLGTACSPKEDIEEEAGNEEDGDGREQEPVAVRSAETSKGSLEELADE